MTKSWDQTTVLYNDVVPGQKRPTLLKYAYKTEHMRYPFHWIRLLASSLTGIPDWCFFSQTYTTESQTLDFHLANNHHVN